MDPLLSELCYCARINYACDTIVETTTIQNSKGERLVMENIEEKKTLLIARCPSNVGEMWLDEKFQGLIDFNPYVEKRRINIYPLEIFL